MANPLIIRDLKLYFRIKEHINKHGSVRIDLDPCWNWERYGSTTNIGAGILSINGDHHLVHILMHRLFNKKSTNLTENVVRHKCDNPSCCNPKHLESGTQADNVKDMWLRNRAKPQGKTPFTLADYQQVIKEYKDGVTVQELTKKWKRDRSTISGIVNGWYKPYLKLLDS